LVVYNIYINDARSSKYQIKILGLANYEGLCYGIVGYDTVCSGRDLETFLEIYCLQTWTEAITFISSKSWYLHNTLKRAISTKKAKLWCLKGTFSINLLLHCYMKMPGKRLHILYHLVYRTAIKHRTSFTPTLYSQVCCR